jgi:hypothetical protein
MSYPFLTRKGTVKPVKRISSVNLLKAKAALKPVKPGRLVTSLKLRKAKAALKPVVRPKPKPRVTGYNLREAKARLRKVQKIVVAAQPNPKVNASARKPTTVFGGGLAAKKNKHKPFPREVLRSAKFNKMVTKVYENRGRLEGGANFQNAWNKARRIVINKIQARLNNNKPPFTPSPLPPPLSPLKVAKPKALSPPKPKPKAPSPPKPKFKLSPGSGRAKIQSKNSGRWVYANLHYSMDELKSLATRLSVDVKGLRSKADIAKKLFG